MLTTGDLLLIAHRRLFRDDERRFFIGEVQACGAGIVKVNGRSYVPDPLSGRVLEKSETRTKLFSIASGTLIIYELPKSIRLDDVEFHAVDGALRLTDGAGFHMDLAERIHPIPV